MGKIYTTRYHDESTVIDRETSLTASSNLTIQDLIKGEAQFDTALGSKNQLTVGAELIFENLESQRITGGEKEVTTDSLFFQNEFRPVENLAFVLGGRLDYHSEFGTHFSPKLSGMYRVTRDVTIRTSYGQGFRAPDFKDLYLDFSNPTSGYQVLGNPDLQPESSGSWNLGVEYQFKSSLLGRVHLYRNNLNNLIEAERIGKSVLGGSKFQYFAASMSLKDILLQRESSLSAPNPPNSIILVVPDSCESLGGRYYRFSWRDEHRWLLPTFRDSENPPHVW